MGYTAVPQSEGPGFKFLSGDRLLEILPSSVLQASAWQYLKLGHDHFLPKPYKFTESHHFLLHFYAKDEFQFI